VNLHRRLYACMGVGRGGLAGPLGFSYILLIKKRELNGAVFRSCFLRTLPHPGNFSADALVHMLFNEEYFLPD